MAGYLGNVPVPQATQTRDRFVATASQTTFATSGYTAGYLDVYLNGVKLDSADYTATNGSDVVLGTGATAGDILDVVAFTTFVAADIPTFTWSVITGATTAEANNGYMVDSSSTGITVTLPATPSTGDVVRVVDLGNAATNNITIARNGEVIQGTADDLLVATNNAAFGLVYSNGTFGWRMIEV